MPKFCSSTLAVLFIAGIVSTTVAPAPAYAGICLKHKHAGTGRAPTKSGAGIASRAKWRVSVIAHGHPARVFWSKSKNRRKQCSRHWYGWKCKSWAVACFPHTVIKGNVRDHR